MTLTQEKQPYGRETRRELTIDGIEYAVRLSDFYGVQNGNERWELRRYPQGRVNASVVDAHIFLPEGSTINQAQLRLVGFEGLPA